VGELRITRAAHTHARTHTKCEEVEILKSRLTTKCTIYTITIELTFENCAPRVVCEAREAAEENSEQAEILQSQLYSHDF